MSIINSQMVSAFTFRKQVEYEKNRTSQIDGYGSIESGLFSDMGGVEMVTNCEFCAFYVLDEEGYGECEVNLDEDEMARFLSSSYQTCPFYQSDDEYKIVRKQN